MNLTHWSRNLTPLEQWFIGPRILIVVGPFAFPYGEQIIFEPPLTWPKTIWRHCCKLELEGKENV